MLDNNKNHLTPLRTWHRPENKFVVNIGSLEVTKFQELKMLFPQHTPKSIFYVCIENLISKKHELIALKWLRQPISPHFICWLKIGFDFPVHNLVMNIEILVVNMPCLARARPSTIIDELNGRFVVLKYNGSDISSLRLSSSKFIHLQNSELWSLSWKSTKA